MKTLPQFAAAKRRGEKIAVVTCYDAPTARLVAGSQIDAVLVGDSVAMAVHGHRDTVAADVAMMALHTAAVRRGLGPDGFVVADLPFLSHRRGRSALMRAVERLMRAGAGDYVTKPFEMAQLLERIRLLLAEHTTAAAASSLKDARGGAERAQIERALMETGGRIGEAARRLGISRTTLWGRMKAFGIDKGE